ncbi:holin [Staphylococcus saprophyticus]|uniref:holin n=1 Tax=Staphylococcus saprophyticus TaxID=29385 RepID=UPI003BF6C075
MEQIIAFAGVISVLTIAITEVLKRIKGIPKTIIPALSMLIGVVIGGVTVFIPEIVTELSFGGRLLAGLISGLMATGLWETFKKRDGRTKENTKIGGGSVK